MPKQSVPTDIDRLTPIIEAMIFASDEPLAPRSLLRLLFDEKSSKPDEQVPTGETEDDNDSATSESDTTDDVSADDQSPTAESDQDDASESDTIASGARPIGQKELRQIVDSLNEEYESTERPFRIVEIAGGFQFATIKEYGEFVGLLSKDKARRRLSAAALETVSIIAYRQPVSKPEIESIRGVNCDQVLLSLLERNLIAIVGRADTVGKPLLYGTTDEFLRAFGLNSLSDLPKLREIEELMEDEAYSGTSVEAISDEVTHKLLELDEEDANLTEGEAIESDEAESVEGDHQESPLPEDETEDSNVESAGEGTADDAAGEETGDDVTENDETSEYRPGGIELVSVESNDEERDEERDEN